MNSIVLTPAEERHLKNLVEEVLHIIKYDDTGVTDDLIEPAFVAAEILGIPVEDDNQQEDEDFDEDL